LHIGCFNQFCNLLCLKTLVKESEKIHRSAWNPKNNFNMLQQRNKNFKKKSQIL
jgi:hypothetical protein